MSTTIIRNARIVNEGRTFEGDVLIKGQRIERVGGEIATHGAVKEIDANGKLLVPGAIDDQVHFREPGLTHKGEIHGNAQYRSTGHHAKIVGRKISACFRMFLRKLFFFHGNNQQ